MTTSILPDPTTTPIKLGRHPKRTESIYAAYGCYKYVATSPDRFRGTPLGRTPVFHATAMFRLNFRTKAEARQMVDEFHRWREADNEQSLNIYREYNWNLARCNELIAEREHQNTFKLPRWIADEVLDRFGQEWLASELFAAAVSDFGRNTFIDYAVAYAEEVERRTAEAREIDDAAHAALTSIFTA